MVLTPQLFILFLKFVKNEVELFLLFCLVAPLADKCFDELTSLYYESYGLGLTSCVLL